MIKDILAIDDSAAMREILAATLRAAGYRVSVAVDGEEGLANARAQSFDLILTDQYMPKRSGLDVIAALRAEPAYESTPIFVLTTEDGDAFKDAARAAGATGWIAKPLDLDTLTDLIAAMQGSGAQ